MNGRYIFAALMLGFAVSACSDGPQSQQMGVSAGGQGLQSSAQRSLGRDSASGYRVDESAVSFDPQESKRVVLNCPKFPSAPAVSGGYYIVPERSPDLVVSGSYPGEASGVAKWYVRVENKSKDKTESASFYVECDTR
jgi:hypothetical protein